ncbi:G-D-S-L family lipolytic protein, partial [Mariprofundus erugo]|uniref:SGNH/GDSL hydrolase family protein n=1 Tax=Mariprofundus erugo TaxID=2528639 RepID=UPI0010FD001F
MPPSAQQSGLIPPLTERESILFFGDSITREGILPDGYITLIAEMIARHHPGKEITLTGSGINGHRVPNCQKRLERDVLQRQPSIVVIYIGINDVWHWQHQRGTPADAFATGLEDIVSRIRARGARVLLCTPSVIGERADGGNPYDAMLDEYADISRSIARESAVPLLDLRQAFIHHLKAHNPTHAASGILTRDGVHLNREGNRLVASLMAQALNIGAGGIVTQA